MVCKGVTWDAANDRKLLMGVIKSQGVTFDYKALAAYMTTEDQVATVESIKNRIKKLKAMTKDVPGAAEVPTPKTNVRKRDSSPEVEGQTPAKRAKAGNTKQTKTAKSKAASVESVANSEEGDGEAGPDEIKQEPGLDDD